MYDKIFPIYNSYCNKNDSCKEVIADWKEAGAMWIQFQFDEATLVKDLTSYQLEAFTKVHSALKSVCSGLNVIVATYFADVPAEAFKTLTSLLGISGYTFDLVHGEKTRFDQKQLPVRQIPVCRSC
ncbi:putative 5-methyltetrahydropteroyltriglutamate--homocysteine S-methyltransferase [Helianthus anomalus]